MVEELSVKLAVDASDFVSGARKAEKSFDRFADGVSKSSEDIAKSATGARDAFGRFVKQVDKTGRATRKQASAFGRLGDAAKKGAKRVRDLSKRLSSIGVSAISGGFRGLTSIVGIATKAVAAFGTALAAVGTLAAVSFAKFEDKFAQVRTLVDESKVDVDSLSEGVRALSVAFGVDALEAVEATYQAISAGQDPARVLKFLEESFKGAAAGAGTTSEAVDAGTTILNAFGKAAGGVDNTFNVLFATIKAGKTTLPELAASIGQVAPVAASAGVSLEETAAALATLTASGLNTAEASTALKATLVGLLKPAGAAEKALLGIGVSAATLRDVGLTDAITKVRDAVASGNGALVDFFPNVRALVGVATLAGEGFEKFGTSLESTTNSAGAASEAFKKTASTTAFAFSSLKRTVEDTFRSIGKAIDPFVKRGIGAFQEFAANAQKEIKLLGGVILTEFAPQISEAFGLLEESASESGSLATTALEGISSGFEFVGKQIRAAAPIISGVVATFGFLADSVKLVGNLIRTAFGAILTSASVAMTEFLGVAASVAGFFSDDLGAAIQEVADVSEAFAQGLAKETVGAFKDTVAAGKDMAEVADVAQGVEKSITRFGLSVQRTAKDVDGLKIAVGDSRELEGMRSAAKGAADATAELDKRTKDSLDARAKSKTASTELASATKQVGEASTVASSGIEKLAASFAKANAGSTEFVAKIKTITDAIAGIGTAQTGEQALEARQQAIVALIGAADAALEGALDAARARALKINATAQANLDAAKDAEREAVLSRDRGAIDAAGAAVSQAQEDLANAVRDSNALFADQKAVAVDAYTKVREEIATTEGAVAALRDATIASAKATATDQIAIARQAFKDERRALIDSLKANEIDRQTFLKRSAEAQEELSRATAQAGELFDKTREKARAAFDLEAETASVNDLVSALTGDLAAAVEQAREDAETYGFTQMELNEALRDIAAQSVETGKSFGDLGEITIETGAKAKEAKEEFEELGKAAKDAAKDMSEAADEADNAASKLAAAGEKLRNANQGFASGGGETQAGVNKRFAGAQFGTQRVTGSSNFQSENAQRLGDALGLGPKALRSRAARTNGGLAALQAQVDSQFVDGGPVNRTGRPQVEAGEFVLSQRGLSDMGRLLGNMLNKGRADTVVNQTNNFAVRGELGAQGSDAINDLAFKLRPALFRTGRLAASQSPVT